jgi:hypothetical protein
MWVLKSDTSVIGADLGGLQEYCQTRSTLDTPQSSPRRKNAKTSPNTL